MRGWLRLNPPQEMTDHSDRASWYLSSAKKWFTIALVCVTLVIVFVIVGLLT